MPWLVTPLPCIKVAAPQYHSIRKESTYPSTYPCYFTEPHEICPEQNTGDVVWKKTPAGDMAAVACPADASGTETARIGLHFVSFSFVYVRLFVIPHYANYKFVLSLINRSGFAPVQPGRCRSCLLGEPNSHQVCLQELREHSDAGKPRIWSLIKRLNASSVVSSYG